MIYNISNHIVTLEYAIDVNEHKTVTMLSRGRKRLIIYIIKKYL